MLILKKSKLFLESLLEFYVKLEIMHKCSNAIKLRHTVNLYNLASHLYAKTLVSLETKSASKPSETNVLA